LLGIWGSLLLGLTRGDRWGPSRLGGIWFIVLVSGHLMLVLVGVGAGGEVGLTLAGRQVRPSGQLLFECIRMPLRDCIQGPMAAIS
jgi:hypothetical protein